MKFLRTSVVAALFLAFVFVPPFAHAQTRDDLLTQLASLQAQLQILLAQANGVSNTFDYNLQLGDTGPDVLLLQRVLNTSSTTQIAKDGYGAPGAETSYFGQLTYGAVLRFQQAYASHILAPLNLTTPTGFVGPATRAVLNSLLHRLGGGTSSDGAGEETETQEEVTATSTPETSLRGRRSGGGGDHTAPDAPGSFAVTAGDGQVTLTWTDPLAGDEETISIYRGTSADSPSLLTTVSPGTETYTDSSLPNDTTYYYALDATDVNENTSSRTATKSATTVGVYDIYVDSVNGDDSNDGISDLQAFQTLAAAQAAAIAEGDGVTIGLKRGSYWREQLQISGLDNVTVSSYGTTGDVPTIDASDVISGWSKTDGQTNVYEATADAATDSSNTRYLVWEDDEELVTKGSVADVDAAAGSFYVDTSGASPVVYVHATGSGNPASNGLTYEVNVRNFGVDLAGSSINTQGNTLTGVHARRGLDNDGSVRLALYATASRVIAESGHKHNMLIGSGHLDDVVLFDESRATTDTTSNMFVGFYDTSTTDLPDNQPVTIKRMFIIGHPSSGEAVEDTTALNNHVNGGAHSRYTVEQLAIKDIESPGSLVGQATTTYTGIYLWNARALNEGSGNMTADYVLVRGAGSGNNGWQRGEIRHMANYGGSVVWNGLTIENSTLVKDRANLIEDRNAANAMVSNYNVLLIYAGTTGGYANLSVDSNYYTGDHNVFYRDGNQVKITDKSDSTTYTTLSGWQAASGQDANSVYLTAAQYADFFLGDPADGDFRINPNAQVTAADGTVYTGEFPDGTPITEAGPRFHWDWNGREAVAGAPTAWPDIPDALAESKEYVLDPGSWDF